MMQQQEMVLNIDKICEGKGVLNNTIFGIIFDMLEEAGIKTHMIKN